MRAALLTPLLLAAVPMLAGATCGRVADPGEPPRLDLAALGAGDLGEAEAARVRDAAELMLAPCPEPQPLAACLRARPPPAPALRKLRLAVALARRGATAAEIARESQRYEASFEERFAIDLPSAPCKGPAEAPVALVVYSDFECPACAGFQFMVDSLVEQSRGRAKVCFRHFPLKRHENAVAAAQAAEFAHAQGRFWELHDRMFERQDALGPADLRGHAAAVGLDAAALGDALDAGRFAAAVQASRAEGERNGVNGTPTLFVNGRRLALPLEADFLSLTVDDELEFLAGRWPPRPAATSSNRGSTP